MTEQGMMRDPEPSARDHRAEPRVRSLLRATISFLNGSFQLETLVRDLSPTGARLAVSTEQTLPELFDISIPKTGLNRRARLVWQRAGEIGIHFEAETVPSRPDPDTDVGRLKARIRELENENRQLKLRIALLTEG